MTGNTKMADDSKDFVEWVCTKCPEKMDDDPDLYPIGCTCNATRDHKPTLCPCRGEPEWNEKRIIFRGGEY
jgi:hypothetical protein